MIQVVDDKISGFFGSCRTWITLSIIYGLWLLMMASRLPDFGMTLLDIWPVLILAPVIAIGTLIVCVGAATGLSEMGSRERGKR